MEFLVLYVMEESAGLSIPSVIVLLTISMMMGQHNHAMTVTIPVKHVHRMIFV